MYAYVCIFNNVNKIDLMEYYYIKKRYEKERKKSNYVVVPLGFYAPKYDTCVCVYQTRN